MKRRTRRILILISSSFFLILAGFIVSLHILVPQKLKQQLQELDFSFKIKYSSIQTSLLGSVVSINDLDVVFMPDSCAKENIHHMHFSRCRLSGINFLKLVVSKTLSVHYLELDQSEIVLDSAMLEKSDSLLSRLQLPDQELFIRHLELKGAQLFTRSATSMKAVTTGNIKLMDVRHVKGGGFKYGDISCNLSNLNYNIAKTQLAVHAKELFVDSKKGHFQLDSLKILSDTVVNATATKLEADGIDFPALTKNNLSANEVSFLGLKISRSLINTMKDLNKLPTLRISLQHLSVDDISIENEKPSSGSIDVKDLRVTLRKEFSFDSVAFSFVKCELSNFIYPLNHDQYVMIKNLQLDSKQEKLRLDEIEIKNHGQTQTAAARVELNGFLLENILRKKIIAEELLVERGKAGGNLQSLFNSVPDLSVYININNVRFNNFSIAYENVNDNVTAKGNILLEDLKIENLDKSFTPDSLRFSEIRCDLSDISYTIPGKFHMARVNKLAMDSRKKIIQLESLKIIPQLDKSAYGKKLGKQANWLKASIPQIRMENVNVPEIFHQKFYADKIIAESCDVYVYRDRRLPRKLRDQMLPVEYLKHLPIDIRINSITIKPSLVVYEEQPRDWIHTGVLKLVNMQMTLSPFINHPQKGDPDHMDMNASGSVMGSGTATANFRLPLSNELYYAKGRFENLSLPTLNSSAENLGVFRINSGLLDFLNFELTMTPQKANGKIVGEYHDLVIDKLKIDDTDSTKKEKAGFSSFMLHRVVIPKNKDISLPERKRDGKIDYLRDPTRFVTFYFIKSLLDGIRSSFTFGFVLPK